MLKIMLAGGGTAGHINPALSIAEIIKEHHPDAKFLFVGNKNGMESRLVPEAGYDFAHIKVTGFQRKLTPKNIVRNIKSVSYLLTAGSKSKKIIKDFSPDIVIGTGGYVSGPIVLKASKMGIKTVIHESNAYPGVTTKLLSKSVDKVMLNVEDAAKRLEKGIDYAVTGMPVRKDFGFMNKEDAKKELGLEDGVTILSFGGSLGAGAINDTVSDLIIHTQEKNMSINHIHSFGRMGENTFVQKLEKNGVKIDDNKRICVKKYIDNMPTCLAAADVVICRCGASTLAEIECVGKASILIPSPVVTDNHQFHNAKVLENANAAVLIEQKELTSELLIETVVRLYGDKEKLQEMCGNAGKLFINNTNERIYDVIKSVLGL